MKGFSAEAVCYAQGRPAGTMHNMQRTATYVESYHKTLGVWIYYAGLSRKFKSPGIFFVKILTAKEGMVT